MPRSGEGWTSRSAKRRSTRSAKQIELTITPARAATFPLLLRIPGWAADASITVNGQTIAAVKPGTFHRVERTWQAGDRVALRFPMPVRATRWYNDSVALERGPLVFSLKIGEDWRALSQGMKKPAPPPAKDWEVHPTTPWNYALLLDPSQPMRAVEVQEKPLGARPYSPEGAPLELRAKGRRVPGWTMVEGSAAAPPTSPSPPVSRLKHSR